MKDRVFVNERFIVDISRLYVRDVPWIRSLNLGEELFDQIEFSATVANSMHDQVHNWKTYES